MTNRPNLTNALDRAQAELGDLYYDPKQDKRRRGFDDTRTPNLTMKHLNKLNNLKKAKAIEAEAKSRLVRAMYGESADNTTAVKGTEEVEGIEPPKPIIEREYEQVVENWNKQISWLFEGEQTKTTTCAGKARKSVQVQNK